MKKRFISIILAISFLFSLIPPVRAEEKAAQTDLEAMIAEQFDAFAKSLKPGSPSDGPMQLVLHSIAGTKDLRMDEDDDLTKSLLNTELLRACFIDTAVTLCKSASGIIGNETVYTLGNCIWYDNYARYNMYGVEDNGNADISDDPLRVPGIYVQNTDFQNSLNGYDEAMLLVVGDEYCQFKFHPVKITDVTISYRVTITICDTFNFDNTNSYIGDNHDLEHFLTWVGSLLTLGLLNTFDWSASVEFNLELPNLCNHVSNNYIWEYDGSSDLISISADSFTKNPLTKVVGTVNHADFFQDTMYAAEVPMQLYHDRPWELEFRCQGTGDFVLADIGRAHHGTFLRKRPETLFFGEIINTPDGQRFLHNYGVNFTRSTGFSGDDWHTYSLRNHIKEDGSNMVQLCVDGMDLGSMNWYYYNDSPYSSTKDWVSGRDFVYQFIGNYYYRIDGVKVDYLKVWENGKENAPFSYLSTSPAALTCTDDGGTLNICSLCGAEFLTEVIPATGHDFTDWQTVKEATCTEEGRMERSCKTCGHRETRPVAVIPHAYAPAVTAPTCTESGFTTYTCECGDSYVADHTDALGHDLTNWAVTNDPTCTDSGMEERWCQRCEYRESRTVDPLGHSYEANVIEPGCTVVGYTEYVCFCGDSYRTNFTNPTGHHYEGVITEPGCTEMGYTTYTCTCGDSYKSNFTAPVGHRHEGVVTAPTCTEGGYTTYTCVCSDSYVSNYTNALGHDYADGICSRCNESDPSYQKPVENPFTDVPEDSFYFSPVLWAVENGITTGASADSFNPGGECMRAHVVTFLWRAAGSPDPVSNVNPFEDVKASDFYYKAVLWAVEKGITNGSDATHFNPFGICNRAQVVTFLYRAFGSPAVESENNPFTDVPTGGWFTAPVLWAVQNGITNGLSADSFGPDAPCNRAQVVTFLHRAYN